MLIYFTGSYFNISSVTTNSYSTVNQIQWSQTISSISNSLLSDENDKKKTESLSEFISPIERLGSSIYIEKNEKPFYSSSKSDILKEANEIVKVNKDENLNYFGNNGLVIVTHANSKSDKYLIVAVNKNYTVKNASTHYAAKEFTNLLLGRTGIIALIIVAVFVLAIVIISFITSKTIVNPIKKLPTVQDEIARGNLDYEIDYKSKNELGQTVESFNQMRLRLKNSIEKQNKADEQRKELIAGIAHDVRTPLTSAKGYAQGLRDGIAATPEKQKKYIDRICSSIDDTEKILNELLDISRYELKSYKLNRVNVNLKEFIDDGAEEIKELLERSNFDFSLQCNVNKDTQISVDTDAFARVFRNIVMNSIKYARDDRQGMVRLIVSEYDRTVIIELTDNGSGVESENLTKIFDTMYRTDPARTKVSQGSGLGLAVCKQIVELHGGLIWASSKQGEGLSIFISMPKIKERTDNIEQNFNS
ncbi:MAG: ATP-binding protein [Eubacterium sp.]